MTLRRWEIYNVDLISFGYFIHETRFSVYFFRFHLHCCLIYFRGFCRSVDGAKAVSGPKCLRALDCARYSTLGR